MGKTALMVLVAVALMAALLVDADAAPEPTHSNGTSLEQAEPEVELIPLGLVALPEGRLLQLTLAVQDGTARLLLLLYGPNGAVFATALPW